MDTVSIRHIVVPILIVSCLVSHGAEGSSPVHAFVETTRVHVSAEKTRANQPEAAMEKFITSTATTAGAIITFDTMPTGALPADWLAGVTGKGTPLWLVKADAGAPSKPNVLRQSGSGDFPWCVNKGIALADGFVEVKFKSIAGRQDQAGGVVWRWKDGGNYYVARANALEDNVSLYYTENGRRNTIKYVNAPVPGNTWHTLRAEFRGTHIRVILNGKTYIDVEDSHIAGAGKAGVWTKADSVTAFDDFSYGPPAAR